MSNPEAWGINLICQNSPTGTGWPVSWQGEAGMFAGMFVPVKLGLSFPIRFWALSPQARGKGEVKTQEEMSLPIKV